MQLICEDEVQETPYGPLPAHWRVMPLEQCAVVQTGVAKGRKIDSDDMVTVPYLRVANVQDGYLDLSEIKEITIRRSEVDRFALQGGDVLLTEGGDFDKLGRGFLWHSQIPGCVHQNHIFAVRSKRELLDPEFLAYLIQSSYGKGYFLSVAHKTTNLACINTTKLKALPTPIPPKSEQRTIANILHIVQRAKDAAEAVVVAARRFKQSLLRHLFTYGPVPFDQTNLVDTVPVQVGEVPASWRLCTLGELLREGSGDIQSGPFGSQLHASDYKTSGVPVVNPTHLGFNEIVDQDIPRINQDDANRLDRHYLQEGDVLIARRGDFSRFSYITNQNAGWLCGTGCIRIRISHGRVDSRFLGLSFSTDRIQNYLRDHSVGTIMPNLNGKIVAALPICLPSLPEQEQIVESLLKMDDKIRAEESRVSALGVLFTTLLRDLMTGRVRVHDLDLPILTGGGS